MVKKKDTIIVIPSRINSKRLPNKPLLKIHGKPMILWVADRIRSLNLNYVIATDSKRILNLCLSNEHKAILTPKYLQSGTERISYLSKNQLKEYSYFINVQGDEPLVNLKHVKKIIKFSKIYKDAFLTAITKISTNKNNPSFVKVAFTKKNRIVYLSRSLIPFSKDKIKLHKIVGIYSYSKNFLKKYSKVKIGKLELIEKIEQLRCIEGCLDIFGIEVGKSFKSVDTHKDLSYFNKIPLVKFKI